MTDVVLSPSFVQRTLSSLRSRNFRLFFLGQSISNTGNWLTLVALTLLVLHRTNSGVAVGVLSACQFGPILLLSAWAGVMIDRSHKRNLLIAMQALSMCQSFVLAALAFQHEAPLWAFYVTAAVGGCLLAVDNPVRRAFVNEMVPVQDIPNAVTLYSAMVNIARVGGPALAGVLIVTVGYGWSFTVDAISYVAVLVALAMMRESELRRSEPTTRAGGQVRAGLRYVAGVPDLWITFAMLLIIGILSANFTVVFPLFVEKALHGSDTDYTLVYSAFSVGALVGALAVARRTVVTRQTVIVGAIWLGLSMLLLAAVPNVLVALVVVTGVGASSVAYLTAATVLAQVVAEPMMMGRVLGLQAVLIIGTTPLGGPLLGAISDNAGARWPIAIGGMGALMAAAFGAVAGRSAPAL